MRRETAGRWQKKGEPRRPAYEYLKCHGAYPLPENKQVCDVRKPVSYQAVETQIIKALISRSQAISKEALIPIEQSESFEIVELRSTIEKLKALNDPDLLSAILAKEKKSLQF